MLRSMTPDLERDPAARRFTRLSLPCEVEIAAQSGVLETLEGAVTYAAGDALVTGVTNERWPIKRARFDATYDAMPGTSHGESGWYRRHADQVIAKQMNEAFSVPLGAHGELRGQPDDWLVQYADGGLAVVATHIFLKTYTPAAS
jgi:hypothetical protein